MTQDVHPLVDLVEPSGPYPAPAGTTPAAPPVVIDRPQSETLKRRQRLLGTLGARLIAGVVAVVLLVVVATGVATYLSLHSYLFGRLDKQLTNSAQGPQIQQSLTSSNRFGGTGPSPQKVWLAVLDQDGGLFAQQASNSATQQLGLTAEQRASLVDNQNQHLTITSTDGTELRVMAESLNVNVAVTNSDGTISRQSESLVFVVGLSTDEINRTMERLVVLELIIGAGA
ncbi:MAG: Two-component system OmpR family sensor kinase, partial [Pseudonocardiales bacterium]|nr:Two-component system OmpR family sensor kinase [Pseudonocardiales bacterium]